MDCNNIICFHNPNEENGYLSNWYYSEFKINGMTFSSMEQYMMYQKAITFSDSKIAEEIMKTDNVAEIKSLGRKVQNFSDTVWNGVRQIVVYNGLLAKFSQNPELRQKLLDTQNSVLAECAVKDTIWGIGISMKDEKRHSMSEWRGQNLLGFSLMEVRNALNSTL